MKLKVLLVIIAAVLTCGCVVGGTTAWLQSRSAVVNTFAAGNIYLLLTETTGSSYQLIPGATIAKDPRVTVQKGSVDCWLFVQVEKTNDPDSYISYTVADGWTLFEDGIYYRKQAAPADDVTYPFLAGDRFTVRGDLTVAEMSAMKKAGAYPTMKLTAYAVQQNSVDTVLDAWNIAKTLS